MSEKLQEQSLIGLTDCDGILRARYRNSFERAELMIPVQIYRFEVDMWATAQTFLPGQWRKGKRSITADTALRLSRYFGLSERFWLNLQARYDLEVEKDRLEGRLEEEAKVLAASPTA